MPPSYASPAELAAWLPDSIEVDGDTAEVERLLARATQKMDATVRAAFTLDDDGLPVDEPVATALRDATCAQVEYWVREVGEEHDVAGMGGRQVALTGLSMQSLPPDVAPRARELLATAGLLSLSTPSGYPAMAGWAVGP